MARPQPAQKLVRHAYDKRFKAPATHPQWRTLEAAPIGSTVTLPARGIVFTKTGPRTWESGFRGGISSAEVTTTFDGTEVIDAAPVDDPRTTRCIDGGQAHSYVNTGVRRLAPRPGDPEGMCRTRACLWCEQAQAQPYSHGAHRAWHTLAPTTHHPVMSTPTTHPGGTDGT
jgi:hypothetical protein